VKLREPYTFFVDRSLGGGVVVDALKASGYDAHAHDDFFAQDTQDAEWLVAIGERGWVVLTKDEAIFRNPAEIGALLRANVAIFTLGSGNVVAAEMAKRFLNGMRAIHRTLRRFDVPVAATLTANAVVRVRYAAGRKLEKAIELK
jgi:hypothetical protein